VKVVRLPYAGVLEDEVIRGISRPNTVGRAPRRAPDGIGLHPVAVRVVEMDSPVRILADRVFSNRVPVALTGRRAIKIDSSIQVPANRAIQHRIPVTLPAVVAIKMDAILFVPADDTIGNRVPVALAAVVATKIDAI